MIYKQISTVAFDDLAEDQARWLERQDPAKFVCVVLGDESAQYTIQPIALSLAEVLAEAAYGQRIVFGEKPRRAPRGTRPVPAYYRGEYAYEVGAG